MQDFYFSSVSKIKKTFTPKSNEMINFFSFVLMIRCIHFVNNKKITITFIKLNLKDSFLLIIKVFAKKIIITKVLII